MIAEIIKYIDIQRKDPLIIVYNSTFMTLQLVWKNDVVSPYDTLVQFHQNRRDAAESRERGLPLREREKSQRKFNLIICVI